MQYVISIRVKISLVSLVAESISAVWMLFACAIYGYSSIECTICCMQQNGNEFWYDVLK